MGQLNERQKLIVSSVVMFIIVILVNLKCIKVSLFDVVDWWCWELDCLVMLGLSTEAEMALISKWQAIVGDEFDIVVSVGIVKSANVVPGLQPAT